MKKLVYVIAIMIFCVSCEDFLDLQPKDSLTPENYYNTASEVEKALNGVYHVLVLQGGADFILNAEVMTDNCVYSSASGSEWLAFTKGTLNPSTSYVATKWENNYKGIARANLVIENLNHKESMIISESDRLRFLGEAHFLRAYFYADLLNFYGGVPIVMSTLDNIKDYNLPRSAPESVLDTILYDVNIAIENLKEEAPANNLGRATKGAALFLKAKVLLFNERYAESYTALQTLNQLEIYELLPNYADIFAPSNENNQEVIFDIQYADANNTYSSYPFYSYIKEWSGGYVPTVSLAEDFYDLRGGKVEFPPKKFGDFFKNRDKRMAVTLTRPLDNWGDGVYIPKSSDKKYYNSCMKVNKYFVYSDLTNSNKRSTLNIILFRYADAKLMQAECIIEDDILFADKKREAITLLDEVRNRAGLPAIEQVIASPSREELREILRRERRCELAFENSRLNDIRRWKIAEEVMCADALGYDPEAYEAGTWETYPIETNRLFLPHQYLWPIPQSEMDANTGIDTNNPGY